MIFGNGDILNAFTVDVEDYYHSQGFANTIDPRRWDDYESRVVANTHRILRILDDHQVRGTFFVLGWVAERFPQLVRDIHCSGHEVGSHGHWHRLIYDQTPEQFRVDLQESRAVLENAIGERVSAYRAPTFSITKRSLWALDVLAEEGFVTDTSIFPIHHDRYGIPDAEPAAHRISTSAGFLWEFPSSVCRFAGLNLPISGGGYFRLYPVRWTLRLLASVNRKRERPFVFYVHPWELDPQQPRLKAGTWTSRARHYLNLKSTEQKLERLLRSFRFGRLSDVIGRLQPPAACPLAKESPTSRRRVSPAAADGKSADKPQMKMQVSPRCADCMSECSNGSRRCPAPVYELVSAT